MGYARYPSAVIGLCYLIRRHYTKVRDSVRHLEETLSDIPASSLSIMILLTRKI